jgi:hypothetical protein
MQKHLGQNKTQVYSGSSHQTISRGYDESPVPGLAGRYYIQVERKKKVSLNKTAQAAGRSQGTIFRELKNSWHPS